MYVTVPLHYPFIAFSHAQKVSLSEIAIVQVPLMITEVDLAKTMQYVMRNAFWRSILPLCLWSTRFSDLRALSSLRLLFKTLQKRRR